MNPVRAILVILHIILLPVSFVQISLLFFYKTLATLSAQRLENYVEPIPAISCGFISDKIWNKPHSSIVCALEVNKSLTKEQAVEEFFQPAYDIKDKNNLRCFRELSYAPVFHLGYGFWVELKNFEIINQVHDLNKHSSQDPEEQEAILLAFVEELQRKPYRKNAPLWDAYLIHKYKGEQTRTLFIVRFHHMMADGISFLKFFYTSLTGRKELPQQLTKASVSVERWKQLNCLTKKVFSFLNFILVGYIDYLYAVLIQKDRHSMHYNEEGKIKYIDDWICSIGEKLKVSDVKIGCKKNRCSVTHILLAGITKGIENYLEKYHNVSQTVHFLTALPMPGHPELRFTNHWCLAKIAAKLGIDDISSRINYFKKEYIRSTTSNLPYASAAVLKYVCSVFPVPLANVMTKAKGASTVIFSNLIGPIRQEDLRLPISNILFWMPIIVQSSAMTVAVMSYNGELCITTTADIGYIPTKEKLQELTRMIRNGIMDACENPGKREICENTVVRNNHDPMDSVV